MQAPQRQPENEDLKKILVQFSTVNRRLDAVDQRLDSANQRLDSANQRLDIQFSNLAKVVVAASEKPDNSTLPETTVRFTVTQLVAIASALFTLLAGVGGLLKLGYDTLQELRETRALTEKLDRKVTKEQNMRKAEYFNRYTLYSMRNTLAKDTNSYYKYRDSTLYYDVLRDTLVYKASNKN